MAGRRLPGHLASLLRHREEQADGDGAPAASASAADGPAAAGEDAAASGGKAARRAALKRRRRERLAAERAAATEAAAAKDAAKAERRAQREAMAAAPAKEEEEAEETPRPAKRKLLKTKKRALGRGASSAAGSESAPSRASGADLGIFDPGAEADEEEMRYLEAKLGISGDPGKRQKMERSIFRELGWGSDDSDSGGEGPTGAADDGSSGAEELHTCVEAGEAKAERSAKAKAKTKAKAGSKRTGMAALLKAVLGT